MSDATVWWLKTRIGGLWLGERSYNIGCLACQLDIVETVEHFLCDCHALHGIPWPLDLPEDWLDLDSTQKCIWLLHGNRTRIQRRIIGSVIQKNGCYTDLHNLPWRESRLCCNSNSNCDCIYILKTDLILLVDIIEYFLLMLGLNSSSF